VVGPDGKGRASVLELLHEPRQRFARYATGSDGSVRINGIPAGSLLLDVRHVDHPRLRVRVDVAPGANTDLDRLELGAGGVVSGTISGPDGTPIDEVVIYVLDADGKDAGAADCAGGTFRSPVLAAGRYTLMVQGEGMAPEPVVVMIANGVEAQLPIQLIEGIKRRISVTAGPPGTGLVTVAVFASPIGRQGELVWRTHLPLSNGRAEIDCGLAPGGYRVVARDDRQRRGEGDVVVRLGDPALPVAVELR
jgi:hypothetical protein